MWHTSRKWCHLVSPPCMAWYNSYMKDYHLIWASKHGVSDDFVSQATAAGFDIHHIDGDHGNNAPENLVMIYSGDHFAFHGAPRFAGRADGVWMTREELDERKKTNGQKAYEARLSGKRWAEIDIPGALNVAKFYAQHAGLKWPINVKCRRRSKWEMQEIRGREWLRRAIGQPEMRSC